MSKKRISSSAKIHPFKDLQQLSRWLIPIAVVTFLVYLPIFNNGYTSYDDHEYVLNNEMITSLAPSHLAQIATTPVAGNYHPLTMLTYALGHQIYGTNATGHHLTNLLIHILNAILVFYFVWLLTKRKKIPAAVVSILFAIHPMHVESVCWMAERKDTLYAFFLLLACIQYFFYLKSLKNKRTKQKHYVLTWVFFVCSVLSKGMGVVIPLLFLAIDYYVGRLYRKNRWSRVALKEKIPFLIFSLIMGVVAVKVQGSVGALTDGTAYNLFQRLIFASYGFLQYIVKMFLPFNLSIFYAYPYDVAQKGIPFYYYIAPLIVVGILATLAYFFKNNRHKVLIFGMSFFAIAIVLVLQVLSVGSAIIADRYTYVAYLGLFFIIAYYFNQWWNRGGTYKSMAQIGLGIYLLLCSVLTFTRVQAWENAKTLFTGVIENYPREILPYNARAGYYVKTGQLEKAMADYRSMLKINPSHPRANLILADLQRQLNPNQALETFNNAIRVNPNESEAYLQRGIYYNDQKNLEAALTDYNKAISLAPDNARAYYNRGNLYIAQKQYELAKADFTKTIEFAPDFTSAYTNRGNVHKWLGDMQASLADYTNSIEISSTFNAHLNRALLYRDQLQKPELALEDANQAIGIKPESAKAYSIRSSLNYQLSKYEEGIADAGKALQLQPNYSEAYIFRAYIYKAMNNNVKALADAQKAKELGYPVGEDFIQSLQ